MANEHHKANPNSKAVKLNEKFGDPMSHVGADGKVDWSAFDQVIAQIKADEQAGNLVVVNMAYEDHNGERNFHLHTRAV